MLIKIYILIDPITNKVRYVGKTKGSLEKRLYKHCCDKHKYHKALWVQKLKRDNLKPLIYLIDEVLEKDWIFWEQYWIEQFKAWGFDLTNTTLGGEGLVGIKRKGKYKHTEIAKLNISIKNKAIIKTKEWITNAAEAKKKAVTAICPENNIIVYTFNSTTDAAIFLGNIDYKKNIVAVLKGRRNLAYKFKWEYKV